MIIFHFLFFFFPDVNPHVAVKKLTYDMADKAMQCKEENDPIPIIKINSVCSMASPASSPQTEVRSAHNANHYTSSLFELSGGLVWDFGNDHHVKTGSVWILRL